MPHAGTWRARPLHATAPPAAAASTRTRPSRGRDPQPARVATTSPASARADASSHPRTGERWRWASSVPRPRATSRAPRARVKVLVDARPASVPTQGRDGSVGAAKATTPRAVRTHASACTASSLRRSESASTPSSYWVRIPNRGSRTVLLSTSRTTMRDSTRRHGLPRAEAPSQLSANGQQKLSAGPYFVGIRAAGVECPAALHPRPYHSPWRERISRPSSNHRVVPATDRARSPQCAPSAGRLPGAPLRPAPAQPWPPSPCRVRGQAATSDTVSRATARLVAERDGHRPGRQSQDVAGERDPASRSAHLRW
jgi:hypothetical protein